MIKDEILWWKVSWHDSKYLALMQYYTHFGNIQASHSCLRWSMSSSLLVNSWYSYVLSFNSSWWAQFVTICPKEQNVQCTILLEIWLNWMKHELLDTSCNRPMFCKLFWIFFHPILAWISCISWALFLHWVNCASVFVTSRITTLTIKDNIVSAFKLPLATWVLDWISQIVVLWWKKNMHHTLWLECWRQSFWWVASHKDDSIGNSGALTSGQTN